LFPDSVVRKQRFVFVNAGREPLSEILDKVEHRAATNRVHPIQFFLAAVFGLGVLRHRFRQVTVDAARTIVSCVHARTRDCFVAIHEIFAFPEAVEEHRHRTNIQAVRTEPHQVIQYAGDFIEHNANVFSACGHFDAKQLFDRQNIAVLIAHHRDVIESIHVADALVERLRLCQLFRPAMQQSHMRVCLLNGLALNLKNETQYTVRRRMLRAEVHCVALNLSHRCSRP